MFNRRSSQRKNNSRDRKPSLRFETLETRTVMSAAGLVAPDAVVDDSATYAAAPAELAPAILSTEDWVHSLTYQQFSLLDAMTAPLLTTGQTASIPDVGWFSTMSAGARGALNQQQVQSLKTATVRIMLLTPQQVSWLTVSQIQSLAQYDFKYLNPSQIPLLTPQQIATIPDPGPLTEWSAASRAALTATQVQSLRVASVGLQLLTPQQRSFLTDAQIRSLPLRDFKYLSPAQIPILTPQQIATIPDPGPLSEWTAESRAALTQPQVQAINVARVRIAQLTPQQISWLTAAQIQSLAYYDFQFLSPSQIPLLTNQQISTIPDPGPLSAWTPAARAALTLSQVQSLNVAKVGLHLLTPTQISLLNVSQVQSLNFGKISLAQLNSGQISWITPSQIRTVTPQQLHLLSASQVPSLTTTQIAAIPDEGFFSLWSKEARAALTVYQIQALNVGKVHLNLLTVQQLGWITSSQVKTLSYVDFQYVNPYLVPLLTPAQIATIPNAGWFAAWASDARAALTVFQIQALDVANVHLNLLTKQQLGWITQSQVQSLEYFDFQYVNPILVPLLTPAQIATIPDPGPFVTWAADARAALTASQIRALNVAKVRIELLAPQQISWLSVPQIQSLGIYDSKLLNSQQIPYLTTMQIASINDPGPITEWTPAARAALTAPQIQALKVKTVRINLLTPSQISFLTTPQIQSLMLYDFPWLNPNQVPLLTTAQIASIPNPGPFAEWTSAGRAALTTAQIRSLNVAEVRIGLLTRQQISWLTTAQIQSLNIWDIPLLADDQIPQVSPQQFSLMPNRLIIDGFSDAVKARLTRAQLLALPYSLMPDESTQTPPASYVPAVDIPVGTDGIQDTPHMDAEATTIFNLVPYTAVTHAAIRSGNWTDPTIWQNGVVPATGAKVLIASGTTVRFDANYQNTVIKTLRIDGTLTFATNINTQLKVDTVVVHTTGRLHVGTITQPIADNVTARILVADTGAIDRVWDPYLWSRGVISRGEVRIFGKFVTPFTALSVDPKAGDTKLYLAQVPVGWSVGDELAIAGVDQYASDFGTDRVRIRAINGNVVTVDALKYSHDAPDGRGLSIHVANLTRNVQFVAEDPTVIAERPHLAFVHNPDVIVSGLGVYGFGRTDKTKEINSPVVVNGAQLPGTGTNARARYAMHFHHTGVGPESATALVQDSVIDGSPGWGYVNHSSKVNFDSNVAYGVVGAGFATEDGNEVGAMRYNLSMQSTGSGDFLLSRRDNHDFGHGGHGFWFQGPGIEVVGNIAAANAGGAFAYITSSSKNLFDAVNLTDVSLAAGHKAIPVGAAPLRRFEDNVAYSSQKGLDIWFHQLMMTDGETVIKDFTSWNTTLYGIDLSYSGQIKIVDSKLIGDLKSFSGYGVLSNRLTHDVTFENLQVEGFWNGVHIPPRGENIVIGGRYANVRNFYIEKAHDTVRTVTITGAVQFGALSAAQLRDRIPYNFYLSGQLDFDDFLNRKFESLISDDVINVSISGMPKSLLQFFEQSGSFTPFPTMDRDGLTPSEYVGKSNRQLWELYGVAYGGSIASPYAVTQAGVHGYVLPVT
jgi:DNA polymerase III psi subunit